MQQYSEWGLWGDRPASEDVQGEAASFKNDRDEDWHQRTCQKKCRALPPKGSEMGIRHQCFRHPRIGGVWRSFISTFKGDLGDFLKLGPSFPQLTHNPYHRSNFSCDIWQDTATGIARTENRFFFFNKVSFELMSLQDLCISDGLLSRDS